MKKPVVRVAAGVVGVFLLFAATWINIVVLAEAYGEGPPYYSRSTNMDKWSNPLPFLISLDIVVLGLATLALRFASGKTRA